MSASLNQTTEPTCETCGDALDNADRLLAELNDRAECWPCSHKRITAAASANFQAEREGAAK